MKLKVFLAVLCALVFACLGTVYGQGATGTILGTVTDSTGAVMAGTTVNVTNVSTGVEKSVQTTSTGDYTVPYLQPGTYRVSVEAPGFQKEVVSDITLVVAQEARINLALKPGAVSQTVEVQGSAVTLDTDSSAVSQLVSDKQVADLPLNGRNFQQLLFIGAGAVQTGGEQASFRQGEGAAISINGSRPESNNYLIDGMLNTDQAVNTPAVVLSVDAIQEFKVLSETYSAQYGFGANQISIVSKGGGNDLHGTAFWFGRNDAFDAHNFFDPAGSAKAKLRQNQFGFVVSGPVELPKYNGRNKTFFLANFEGWRVTQGSSGFANVPVTPELSGFFTHSVTNPITHAAFAGCVSGGVAYTSCIPAGSFSRVAQVGIAAGFFPAPNCSGCAGGNYRSTVNLPASTNQQTYRIDQELGKWGKVFGRGTYSSANSTGSGTTSGPLGTTTFGEQSTNWAVSHTISFGPNKVNQFSFGRLNAVTAQGGFSAPASVISALNYTGIFTNLSGGARVYPTIAFNNTAGQAPLSIFGGAVNAFEFSGNPMWQFVDDFTLIKGPHTLTFGGDYKRWKLDRNVSNNFLGNYGYAGFASGDQFADFLLGDFSRAGTTAPGPFTQSGVTGAPYEYNFQYFATFLQDDWKISQKLTLNLGLRWDLRSTPYETNNHFGWLDVSNPLGGVCMADPKIFSSGIAGNTGVYRNCGGNSPKAAEKKNFAPRFGFAWRPFGEKTVLRGGYALFWDGIEGREMDGNAGFYPYQAAVALNQTAGQASYTTTDQLFPVVPATSVGVGPNNPNNPVVTMSAAPFDHNPYVQQYTLSVQRELFRNTILDVSYVGNKGTHLLTRTQINQALPMANPAFCNVTANQSTPACAVPSRRPLQNFSNSIWIDDRFEGYSNYNAGTVKLERRSSSLAFTGVYTWSKSMDDKSAAAGVGASQFNGWQGFLNNHNPTADYSRSDYDTGQRFVASMVYDLPVGRGKRLLGSSSSVVNAVVGNWQLSTIFTAQLGFPMSIQAADNTGLLDTFGTNRADIVGNPSGPKSLTQWFNTAAFKQPANNLFGNSSRNSVRMPGINDWDLGLMKNIVFTERVRFQFRLETFNTFNHPNFDPDPSTSAFGGGGTTVDNNVNDTLNFGKITAAAPGRIIQLGAKLIF